MKISKIHRMLSYRLEERKALTNPEDFLGPNWEDVINFWLYVDGLSEDERKKMTDRYWGLDGVMRESSSDSAEAAAEEIVGEEVEYAAWIVAFDVTGSVFAYATSELIASHKLLEQGKSLVFLPLCLKP
jgi:hypothetical protein